MKRVALIAGVSLAAIVVVGAIALASGRGPLGQIAGRYTVPAPIDLVEVLIRESAPPQVTVKVRAGLPGGCAERSSHALVRAGDTFTLTVLNSMPSGNPVCTMIYGMYELNIDLGREFLPGTTYTVHVNDKITTFRT